MNKLPKIQVSSITVAIFRKMLRKQSEKAVQHSTFPMLVVDGIEPVPEPEGASGGEVVRALIHHVEPPRRVRSHS